MLSALDSDDPELLRQANRLLVAHNEKLVKCLEALTERVAALEGRDLRQADFDFLDALEPAPPPVARPSAAPEAPPSPRAPRRGHGPRPQPELLFEEQRHELPADERDCSVCGGELEAMGDQTEDAEEITVVERIYKIVLHRRQKYRCRCNANVVTAPGPPKLIPGGRYSIDVAVQIAVDKYADHLPLERQADRMARWGLDVTSSTLWDQLEALSRLLEPTWHAIGETVLGQGVVHADETAWHLWRRNQKIRCPWTVWSLSTPDLAYYAFLGSKSEKAARRLFRGYDGIVVADGYQVYQSLSRDGGKHLPGKRAGPGFRLAHCWAHVLRKYREIDAREPGRCTAVLDLIGELYKVERRIEGPFPGNAEARAKRLALRKEESKPILESIKEWAHEQGGLRRSDFGSAIRYMLERWNGLTLFLEDPRVPLDNNAAERRIRRTVIGRKNHYGSRSRRGTEVAACCYSVIETALLRGVEPTRYLRELALAGLAEPGAVILPNSPSTIDG